MTKEEILEAMKEWVLSMQKLSAKEKAVQESLKNLNSCDMLWITDQYAKFHKAEIAPNIPKDLPKIPDQP